jgi:hypothetical protein
MRERQTGPNVALLAAAALAVTIAGCDRAAEARSGGAGEPDVTTTTLAADLALVRQERILFTHHSVGVNILAGIGRLDADEAAGGPRLRMVLLDEAEKLDGPVLAHGGGGRNTEPKTKIDHFAETIRRSPGLRPRIALMKLCYVDFEPSTNVDDLFAHYRRTLEALEAEHPEIRFAHVTVPLFRRPTDLKSRLRRLLGKEVWDDVANAKRSEFSARLRQTFPDDPIFDLAAAEARGPDGSTVTSRLGGVVVPTLHPAYTDDGGHLNDLGQRVVGAAAIRFLADAVRADAARPRRARADAGR